MVKIETVPKDINNEASLFYSYGYPPQAEVTTVNRFMCILPKNILYINKN